MSDPSFPESLIVLQRASTAAWDAVEAHRKAVDAKRREDPRVEHPKFGPMVRAWHEEENARHAELMAAVEAAADARQAALDASGLGAAYTVVQALHLAARQA